MSEKFSDAYIRKLINSANIQKKKSGVFIQLQTSDVI